MSTTLMPMAGVTRAYRSTRRAEQAALTRRAILDAARQQFATAGFSATTIERIAQAAGVAVQTVYATWGSKVALLEALNELIDAEGGVSEVLIEVRTTTDPERVLGYAASITRELNERFGDIMRVLYFAAHSDPAAAPIWTEGLRRHRLGAELSARRLETLGALRPEVTTAHATDVIDFLTRPQAFVQLVDELGWTYADAEAWICATMRATLLRPPT